MKNSGRAETYQHPSHLLFLRTPLPEMTGYKYTYFGTCSDKQIFKKQVVTNRSFSKETNYMEIMLAKKLNLLPNEIFFLNDAQV